MKKTIHIVKANLRAHKGGVLSLFIILLLMSAIAVTGLSVMLGLNADYQAGADRLNSLHSAMVMTKDMYLPAFEEFYQADPRVAEYEIGEMLAASTVTADYGGTIDLSNIFFFSLGRDWRISPPVFTERDETVPAASAVYLPETARSLGYQSGDQFSMVYKNAPLALTVAGFYETNELSTSTTYAVKVFVPEECYESLKASIQEVKWLAARLQNAADAAAFNMDFVGAMDVDFSAMGIAGVVLDAGMLSQVAMMPVMIFMSIVVIFALMLVGILLIVVRSRVNSSIEDAMHAIGVLQASGYTGRQIVACYLVEYGALSLVATLLGVLAAVPVFPLIRSILSAMSGLTWTLGINIPVGLLAAVTVSLLLLLVVWRASARVKQLPPVAALRGGLSVGRFRHNYFPLSRGAGGVQLRLGLKSMFAYGKLYAMIGIIMLAASFAVAFMVVVYQGFVVDTTVFSKIAGFEMADVALTVSGHTDADALAAEIGQMPEVRKTSMFDVLSTMVEGHQVQTFLSDDYSRMETMHAHTGRFPIYDNEVAVPKIFADQLGKQVGDSIEIRSHGVTREMVITGFYSTVTNGGQIVLITLDGYQWFDPDYRRSTVNVYLNEGVTFERFSEKLEETYGVVNRYQEEEDSRFADAKARAEEKLSNYMQLYDVDSIEYAVIYHGEIILSGSSGAYQIERISNYRETGEVQLASFSQTISLVTQVITLVSLLIVTMILSMTVKGIVAKRRRELGVLKGCGFTTAQLARQLAISFLPAAIVGAVCGCLLGTVLVNPVISALFASSGIYNIDFAASPFLIAGIGAAIVSFAFVLAHLSAMRIRYISVYELLSE